ncbi:TPA: hypothetical protein KOG59_003920 [Clostridioides difficile]|uniref:hypothetical protein n=1 Tax=Clostridioides difficile TaxID=1496 RepID=UPI0012ECF0A6|nr:hypothetical protein [Clostridioides difficile]MBG0197987.1 hypothetical protein [Clostridioides difficile]HBE8980112.1 hypothetical protein [Clostridioides difficile]HBF2386737.1 hypothetical protein [Clostridioides difficile]HBF4158856.1 hypothetical protein [Clostridioides difficile]HBF6568476.1 hypothetical protein [Clostridioides difficile]
MIQLIYPKLIDIVSTFLLLTIGWDKKLKLIEVTVLYAFLKLRNGLFTVIKP